MDEVKTQGRPAGYGFLLETLGLTGMPHWHRSFVSDSGTHSSKLKNGIQDDSYPKRYWPGETLGDHLEFALKYDGVNLALLTRIFETIPQDELIDYVLSKPTGMYARRIWFFYEYLMGERLPVDDLGSGNYVEALESDDYYTVNQGERSSRHRIVNNLLGTRNFCPIVRKSDQLAQLETKDLRKKCEEAIAPYPPELLRRALGYLYHKETKSSFEIEHVKAFGSRAGKFIALLELAEKEDFCEKPRLIELQNRIVDPRFMESDYRKNQNYVGETLTQEKEIIHYVSPKPKDIPSLMEGFIDTHKRMKKGAVSPLVHGAIIAYGFVYLHPFEDGNGRIHRFLIHNILSLKGLVPKGLMFPVSATMLKNPSKYDASLEAFSAPLLPFIDYELDDMGRMTVNNETSLWYQYMDMTVQSEALYGFVLETIEEELVAELSFLTHYDKTQKALQQIIDMPDRLVDLFIRLCLQNQGSLSAKKKTAHFDFLTNKELLAMEQAVREEFLHVSNGA